MNVTRTPNHPIEPLFLARWSPRAFDRSPMPAEDLLTILEAGRWAPSAFNIQPWLFLFALRDDAHWAEFLSVLDPFNQQWAGEASALVFLLSDRVVPGDANRPEATSNYNSFDAGAAWMQIALQSTSLGYVSHAMAGLDFDKGRSALNVPDRFRLEIGIAVGQQRDPANLPDELRQRETPSDRLPLNRIAVRGPYTGQVDTIAAA
ncbi:MAG: nitroreductase family protein [Pseudomonadota bacterium]